MDPFDIEMPDQLQSGTRKKPVLIEDSKFDKRSTFSTTKDEENDIAENSTDSQPLVNSKKTWLRQNARDYMDRVSKSRAFKIFCLVLEVILFVVANYLFVSCDKRCPLVNDEDCVVNYIDRERAGWTIKIIISAFLYTALILLPLFYKLVHPIFGYLGIANAVYMVFFFDPVINAKSYGGVFTLVLGLLLLGIFILFFILQSILFCFRKSSKLTSIICTIGPAIFLVYFYVAVWHGSCARWNYGLGGEIIDNNVGCKVETPGVCTLDILDGIMNFAQYKYKTCADAPTQTSLIKQFYPNSTNYIGLPRLQYAPEEAWNVESLQNYILSNSVSLESLDDPKAKDYEYIIDNSVDKHATLHINVRRNESLVQERLKDMTNQGLAKNVIVLFIDTMSRARMFKKMKKTVSWFEQYYNQQLSEKEAFQFFKFHGITPYTQNNAWAAYTGSSPPQHPPTSPPPEYPPETFTKVYQENGYITARATDLCDTSSLSLDAEVRPYVRDIRFDYEGTAIACDPHYTIDNSYRIMDGPYSVMKRCLYGNDLFQHLMDYGEQFWRAYSTEKKLLYLEFIDAHEPTQEVIKEMDAPLVSFLERLDKDKLLEDTIILLWGDHGDHLPLFPYNLPQKTFFTERALPIIFMIVPKDVAQAYRPNLEQNKQKLVSAFQIHELLLSIPVGRNSSHLKKSLVGQLPNLTCQDINVFFQPCACNY